MTVQLARRKAWKQPRTATALPPPPRTRPPLATSTASGDEEDLYARFEAEQAMREAAECAMGCDYPEGPLSPSGCRW